jgi:hypothetical protein
MIPAGRMSRQGGQNWIGRTPDPWDGILPVRPTLRTDPPEGPFRIPS